MPLRNAKPLTWRVRGVTDAVDGSLVQPGSMLSLQNLVPAPSTRYLWVPRSASALQTTATGKGLLNTPTVCNGLLVLGNIIYGLFSDTASTFSGKDVPFAYNIATDTYETITVPGGATSLPASPATTGDWTPPTMAAIGSVIVITHPGYAGGSGPFFGWLDISGFSSNTLTGNTHSNKTIDTLSANPITAGFKVGMTITSSAGDIPANTTITALSATTITISNNATGSNAGDTLTVAGGTATAPLYGSGNTNINPLLAVPVAVSNFNGRAYFAVPGNGAQFSDALDPRTITNATQALKPANGIDITAWGGLPVSQTQGGILQALIGFQGDAQMQQITGDPATSNLALNNMGVGVGTLAPNTITQTPEGLMFISQDGLRIVTLAGTVTDVIGYGGEGINEPFVNAISPSRMVAAFNEDVFRVSVTNGEKLGNPNEEYWYHLKLREWSGPHNFPAAQIAALQSSSPHGFIAFAIGVNAKLFRSSSIPTLSDTYVENGNTLTWIYQTSLLPDNEDMAETAVVESTLAMALPFGAQANITFQDDAAAPLATVTIQGAGQPASVFGTALFGSGVFGGGAAPYRQRLIPWPQPIVFKQGSLTVVGNSAVGVALGPFRLRYQVLGYIQGAA